jgi:hypothetical protein
MAFDLRRGKSAGRAHQEIPSIHRGPLLGSPKGR